MYLLQATRAAESISDFQASRQNVEEQPTLKSLRRDVFLLVGNEVDTVGELVSRELLSTKVKSTNLGVCPQMRKQTLK